MSARTTAIGVPTGYKGSKRAIAGVIAAEIIATDPPHVYDLCAGSGAITLALIAAGYPVAQITMVEAGPWGMFYTEASEGGLCMGNLRALLLDEMPKDPRDVAAWVEGDVALRDPGAEEFIVLQAASYGSTPVWHDGERWRRGATSANRAYKARSYWEPGPLSKEKHPRGTIFNPSKIIDSVADIDVMCRGLGVIWGEVSLVSGEYQPATCYMDPPYAGDSGYGWTVDVDAVLAAAPRPFLMSEGIAWPGATSARQIGLRRGGAVSAGSARRQEWLSTFAEH